MLKDIGLLDFAKDTAYGLLKSVTEFIDPKLCAKRTDHRLESAWFGNGAVIKQWALDLAGLMVV